MPVTSGVRAVRAFLRVDGTKIPVETMRVSLPAERKSSTFSATVAVSALPPGLGEDYWASQNPETVECVVIIGGAETVLMTGTMDTMHAALAETKLDFSGRCKSAMLHEKKSREKFNNKQPEEIIKDLAGRVGLTANVDSFGFKAGKYQQIDWAHLTYGHSYSEIIHRMADMIGARWWVDGKTLNVKKDPMDGVYVVNYQRGAPDKSDAKRVMVTRNFQAARPAKVTTQGWDPKKKKAIKEISNVSGVGSTIEYTYENHGIAPDKAMKHSKAKAKDHARHEFSISVSMAGDTSVARATKLRLAGNAYAQDFEIDNITHVVAFGGGLQTDITARGPKTGRTPS